MLEGKDFIILSLDEADKLYKALQVRMDKATYRQLAEFGILDLVDRIGRILYPKDDE